LSQFASESACYVFGMVRRASCCLLLGATLALGCSAWFPDFVEQRRFERGGRIDRVAVVPFYPSARLSRVTGEAGVGAGDAAALVTRFVSEALIVRVPIIPENDVKLAFEAQGQVVPRQAPELSALLATSDFGADAVLLGEVHRYREREGSAVGSTRPASVEFVVTLYAAPSATKLWEARFAHTQTSLTSNLFDTARLPGRGSRFLTVAELAQFGAQLVADELPLGR
jgi:hypothetical protein